MRPETPQGASVVSRRRYRYDPERKEVVEIGADWSDVAPRPVAATEELVYGGLGKSTDGVPIDTRRKHREHMKANGLALTGDFTQTWEKAKGEREKFFAGQTPEHQRERREALAQSYEKIRSRRR